MSLDRQLGRGISVLKFALKGTEQKVTHEAFTGHGAGDWKTQPKFSDGVTRKAVVIDERKKVIDREGREVLSERVAVFLEPITVQPEDVFTFADGTSPDVKNVQAVQDPAGKAYAVVVRF